MDSSDYSLQVSSDPQYQLFLIHMEQGRTLEGIKRECKTEDDEPKESIGRTLRSHLPACVALESCAFLWVLEPYGGWS